MTKACVCHTKRSTKACSCKHAACYAKNCATIPEEKVNSVMRRATSPGRDSKSSMAYPFGKGLQTSEAVPFRGIGKTILSVDQRTVTLPLCSNGNPVSHCLLKSTERRQTVWFLPWRSKCLNCRSGKNKALRGIEGPNWHHIKSSPSPQTSMSTFATQAAPGNAGRLKIPMAFYDNTSLRAPAFQVTHIKTLIRSQTI